ncbi:MAG: hypothetical protein ACYCTW_00200 [Sulfuricella sp.]
MAHVLRGLGTAIVATLVTVISASASSSGLGEAGCPTIDSAPVYRNSNDNTVIANLPLGMCVAGVTVRGLFAETVYMFQQLNGRERIAWVAGPDDKSPIYDGWMNPNDLNKFTYECGCGSNDKARQECTPFSTESIVPPRFVFNTCFKQARGKKLAEISSQSATKPVSSTANNMKRGEAALRNDDVLTLVKVGLEENLIISKIQSAAATDFDLSTNGIVALKSAGVTNAVIEAMMKRDSKK